MSRRSTATRAAARRTPRWRAALPAALRALTSRTPAIRVSGLRAVELFALDAAAALPGVVRALVDRAAPVRVAALETLCEMGGVAAPATPELTERRVRARTAEERALAKAALWNIRVQAAHLDGRGGSLGQWRPRGAAELVVARHGSGAKSRSEFWRAGARVGEALWEPDGKPCWAWGLRGGRKHGPEVEWWESGRVAFVQRWVHGVLHGRVLHYDDRGELLLETRFVRGTGVDLWCDRPMGHENHRGTRPLRSGPHDLRRFVFQRSGSDRRRRGGHREEAAPLSRYPDSRRRPRRPTGAEQRAPRPR